MSTWFVLWSAAVVRVGFGQYCTTTIIHHRHSDIDLNTTYIILNGHTSCCGSWHYPVNPVIVSSKNAAVVVDVVVGAPPHVDKLQNNDCSKDTARDISHYPGQQLSNVGLLDGKTSPLGGSKETPVSTDGSIRYGAAQFDSEEDRSENEISVVLLMEAVSEMKLGTSLYIC